MSFIRPEITAGLLRWREVLAASALVGLGLWLVLSGGWLWALVGGALAAAGLGWAAQALRRLRFSQGGEAPGILRVTEGEIAYLGPRTGGFVSLPDLAEIRLLTLRGRRIWKLCPAQGAPLHIPVEAAGADALFDAFATLPGIDMAAIVAALGSEVSATGNVVALNALDRLLWARSGTGLVRSGGGPGASGAS